MFVRVCVCVCVCVRACERARVVLFIRSSLKKKKSKKMFETKYT